MAVSQNNPAVPLNLITILADDLGAWALGCAGNTEVRTPNLDRLARQGIRFTNYYCTSPVCSAARASLLTGRIPSQHGVHDWIAAGNSVVEGERDGVLLRYLDGFRGYPQLLADAGYSCGLSGKWHLGDAHHPQQGYSFWKAYLMAGGNYYMSPFVTSDGGYYWEHRYITDVIGENALQFVRQQQRTDRPFHLAMNFTAPHAPWYRDQHPAEVFNSYHDHCPFTSAPDLPRSPTQFCATDFFDSPQKRREKLSGYYAAITGLDTQVGRLLDHLDESGLRQNTLIFFTSDNGMNMGHHGLCGKGNGSIPLNLFDTSCKVPAIISLPGRVPQGIVCDELLCHYDMMPTFLDYLGLPNPEAPKLPGHSFASLLRGESSAGHEELVVFDEYGPARMIRAKTAKYIHRHPDGPHEFYDLSADPGEERNLIDDPARAAEIADLRSRLFSWFDRYVDPELDGWKLNVTGRGQRGPVRGPGRCDPLFRNDWTFPNWWRPGYEPPKRPGGA